jgi:uncharacterized protein involved in exopolysaccharide biosynthesis/Mrp family chromosome partitioning ATPase
MAWGEIIATWRRYALLIFLVGILGGVCAYLLANRMTPVFETSAVVLFSRSEGANSGSAAGNLGNAADASSMDAMQRASLVRSQVEVIRSEEFVRKVIGQLRLEGSPTFWPKPGLLEHIIGGFEKITGLELRGSSTVGSADPITQVIRQYLNRLAVRNDPDSYVLRIGFQAPDPVEAAAIVNAHVAVYRDWLRDQQKKAIEGSYTWLEASVDSARERVLTAEEAVRRDRAASRLVNIDGRTSLDKEIAQISTELAAAQASLVRSEVRAQQITRMRESRQFAALAAMSGSRTVVELRDRYAAAESELAAARVIFGTNNPSRRTMEASTQTLGSALQAEIEALLQSEIGQARIARNTVIRLTEALDDLKKRVLDAEVASTRLASLEGEVTAERNVYYSQLEKLRGLDNVAALSRSVVTVLSPAPVPPVASAPKRGVFVGFGTCLFVGLAAAGVIWRQGSRDVVRHTDDTIETGSRNLAVMPEFGLDRHTGRLDRGTASYSFFMQELRTVCANLFRDFGKPELESVSVLVTSPLPGDGKTTFCIELGRCAAMNGVRTLIISTDRKPRGDRESSANGEIRRIEPGLPLDQVALGVVDGTFHRRDARGVIENFQRDYGLIVIDTPPLSAMAESVLLAPIADTTIVLARVDKTPRSLLARTVQEIERFGGRLAGVVTTFAQLDSRRGLRPGDRGYYFARNSTYHQRLASGRLLEHDVGEQKLGRAT